MCCIHSAVFWLDRNMFALNWASNCIAQLNEPCVLLSLFDLELGNEDAVVTAGFNVDETLHVLDGTLIDLGVPEGDAHIVSFGFSVSEDNRIVEVAPHVFGLNVGEKDI